MTSRSQLGKRSRAKGKLFQKKVVKLISTYLGIEESELHSCVGGKTENDIQMSAEARRLFPYNVECKNTKTISMKKWLSQSREDAQWGEPLVVFKLHGNSTPYVVLNFEELLTLCLENKNITEKALRLQSQLSVALGTHQKATTST